jgi:hypothetical protein
MANEEGKRLVDLRPDLPREQRAGAAPVVARGLPSMARIGDVHLTPPPSAGPVMERGTLGIPGGQPRMAAVPQQPPAPQPTEGKPQERPSVPAGGALADGYVRLEVRHENGRLSVVGVHEVAGPIDIPGFVARGYVYEASIDSRRVGLGSIPDAGIRRAFANRDVPGPEGKHRFIAEPSFDFVVRIPKRELLATTLPRLTIVLHQVGEAPDRLLTPEPLPTQAGVKAIEVGRLPGIRLEELPADVRAHLERILQENEARK